MPSHDAILLIYEGSDRKWRSTDRPASGFRFVDPRIVAEVAGEQGLEPQLPDPESGVLPLDDSPSPCATSKYSDSLPRSQAAPGLTALSRLFQDDLAKRRQTVTIEERAVGRCDQQLSASLPGRIQQRSLVA